MRTSVGEYYTQLVLEKMQIPYKREAKLENLVSAKKIKLPVDFLIRVDDKVGIIEFNGRQHYHATSDWSHSLDEMGSNFNKRQKSDQRRRNYVFETGIPLLEISFRDFDEIERIIKQFIQHIKDNCSQSKTNYGDYSAGYFTSIKKRKSLLYRKAWMQFATDKPSTQKSTSIDELKHDLAKIDKTYGFLPLDKGKILWTKVQLDDVIKENKVLHAQDKKLKEQIMTLQLAHDNMEKAKEEQIKKEDSKLLPHYERSIKKIDALHLENEKLKENHSHLQSRYDTLNNTYHKETTALQKEIQQLVTKNKNLQTSSANRKKRHTEKINQLTGQINHLIEENKRLETLNSQTFYERLADRFRKTT